MSDVFAATGDLLTDATTYETAVALGAFKQAGAMRATSQAKSAVRGLVPADRVSVPGVAAGGAVGNTVDEDD